MAERGALQQRSSVGSAAVDSFASMSLSSSASSSMGAAGGAGVSVGALQQASSSIGSTASSTAAASASSSTGGGGAGSAAAAAAAGARKVVVKVGMLGDPAIGKTSMMVKYCDGRFDEDYIETLAVSFMEKSVMIRNNEIKFSIWDLGGQKEFHGMLPLVCGDAAALLFLFDLSRKSTLTSVKDWYRQARTYNKTALPMLVGTKYDKFMQLESDEQLEIVAQARRYAKAMKAPLVFCSAKHAINIQKIFKIVLARVFDLKCPVEPITTVPDPLVEF